MLDINRTNGIISLVRGDNATFPLFINTGTSLEPVRFDLRYNPGSELYLGVCQPNERFEDAIIRKKYTGADLFNFNSNGDLMVEFTTEDTEYLLPGVYYYEIKLREVSNAERLDISIRIIDNTSILKAGSKLLSGCIINGVKIEVPDGQEYYSIDEDTQLSIGDVIVANSVLQEGTVVDGKEVKERVTISTVVPKTKFVILE